MTDHHGKWKKQAVLFLVSQCVTLFGSQIVQMAIVWYATLETGSGAWVAAFSLCAYLPQFFVSFLGGVWADRYPLRRLIMGADALIAAVTAIMLGLYPSIPAGVPMLLALLILSILRSAGAGIQTPAVQAALTRLVPQAQRMRWNGVNAALQSVVQFAAPAAAAVLLTGVSLRAALLVDIVTAALGMGLLGFVCLPGHVCSGQTPDLLGEMRSGVRYACGFVPVRNLLIVYGVFLFWSVPAGYLAGLFVSRAFGDGYWYLTVTELVGFGGMAAGGLIMSLWGGFKRQRMTLAMGLVGFGAMAAAMSLSRSFGVYLVFMTIYGVMLTMAQTSITTMLQRQTDSSMQGRVFGLMSSLYASCYPLGMALFGPLADVMSLRIIMMLSGLALWISGAGVWMDRQIEQG